MNVVVVDVNGISTYDVNRLNIDLVGQKAWGLLEIPSLWRLPFLCISTNVFDEYKKAESETGKNHIISLAAQHVRESLSIIGVENDEKIIIRSSGKEEGMSSRGRYDSHECSVDQIEESLRLLFSEIVTKHEKAVRMAFLVQKYIPNAVLGHLSNERRFSKVKRDWVFEYNTTQGKIVSEKICVRYWRNNPDEKEIEELTCTEESQISSALYMVAWYYTRRKIAIHFEFIWDRKKIIIAQADQENNVSEILYNPTSYNTKVNGESLSGLKVLRLVNESDGRYGKVGNSLLYKSIGLCTVPLYILNQKNYINELANGVISPLLEDDLRILSKHSVVIRTDIADVDNEQRQLLKRSNEIRDYDGLVNWLLSQKELMSLGVDIALLFHIFIPAIGAAFVNASPTGRVVEIEALWGLPEGLYYNEHDNITVDTRSISTDIISKENAIILSKRVAYKEHYIAPDEDGRWILKKTAPPFDWNLCINEDSIRQIAVESRLIANMAQRNVNVMWFLGVDKNYYGTANLAWYHEEYSRSGYTTSAYKKKYFYETETVIRNMWDYQAFLDNPNIKEIKLRPIEDDLLRDRDFLRKIGKAAKERDAAIILEGAILAHPLYQLCQTGARVLTPDLQIGYREESNYRKLVRDLIPLKIVSNGESISCNRLENDALLRALMEKAVEEVLEISKASSKDDLIAELGDAYEVLSSILETSEKVHGVDRLQKKNRIENHRILSAGCFVINGQKFSLINKISTRGIPISENEFVEVELSYELTQLQVELHFCRNGVNNRNSRRYYYEPITDDEIIKQLMKNALSLTSYSRLCDIRRVAVVMREVIIGMAKMQGLSEYDFLCVVREKKEKRGGFSKGYLLNSSVLSSENEDDETLQTQLDITGEEYATVSILDYPIVKNADFLDKGLGELVLRISLPLCFNTCQVVFESNTVKKYIGNNYIIVKMTRERGSLHLTLAIQKDDEPFTQLALQL